MTERRWWTEGQERLKGASFFSGIPRGSLKTKAVKLLKTGEVLSLSSK